MHEEPPTNGKVILVTNYGRVCSAGDLDIELWPREAPKTCRNFVQLCIEGYYNHVSFHRLIPGFLIQGGDHTGTGIGGESIFGGPFEDEFSMRLKFAYRGLVGMASSKPNDNKSQFFITFQKVDNLYKKHTLFGKVVGDTIYNLMAMERLETDKYDRPLNPPIILEARVVSNPFNDVFPRDLAVVRPDLFQKQQALAEKEARDKASAAAGQKQKQSLSVQSLKKKQFSQLSFMGDEEYQEPLLPAAKFALPSDILPPAEDLQRVIQEREQSLSNKTELIDSIKTGAVLLGKRGGNREALKKFGEKILDGQEEGVKAVINKKTGKAEIVFEKPKKKAGQEDSDGESSSGSSSEEIEDPELRAIREKQKELYEKMRFDSLQFKSEKLGSLNADRREEEKEEKKLLTAVELKRYKFLKENQGKRDPDSTLSKLEAFRSKLKSDSLKQTPYHWMNAKLKFHIDSAKAYKLQENRAAVDEGRLNSEFQQLRDTTYFSRQTDQD